jgi:hypothetical protein
MPDTDQGAAADARTLAGDDSEEDQRRDLHEMLVSGDVPPASSPMPSKRSGPMLLRQSPDLEL